MSQQRGVRDGEIDSPAAVATRRDARRASRPPAISPRHLALHVSLIDDMLRKSRWLKTRAGQSHLTFLSPKKRARVLEMYDEGRLRRVAAELVGVNVADLPKRPVWRSKAHALVYTVDAAAWYLHCSRKTIYNMLSKNRTAFPPQYRRAKHHPRRVRVLSGMDISRLQDLQIVLIREGTKFIRMTWADARKRRQQRSFAS
jgi:hypothetical protein